MASLFFFFAVFFILCSPVQTQWWSFIWANPKARSTTSPPYVFPSTISPSNTSLGPPEETTRREGKEQDKVTAGALWSSTQTETPSVFGVSVPDQSTTQSWILPSVDNANGSSKSKAKPLKHWKGGESQKEKYDSKNSVSFISRRYPRHN